MIIIVIVLLLITFLIEIYPIVIKKYKMSYDGGRDNNNNTLTYVYMGDQLSTTKIAWHLPGWRRVNPRHSKGNLRVNLVIASGLDLVSRRLYSIKADMKCRLDMKLIEDKARFHKRVAEYAPELIAETRPVTPDLQMEPGDIWIVRAGWGFGGNAVAVVTSTEELINTYDKFINLRLTESNGKVSAADAAKGIIASNYIDSPELFEGRKYHLRIYLMLTVVDGEGHLDMFTRGLIIPAELPYISGDYSNKKIHDTHGKGNPLIKVFPYGIIDQERINLIASALKKAFVPLLPDVKVYSESPAAYELIGADIMFTAAGELKIIEINDRPGLTWLKVHPDGDDMESALLDFIFATGISRVFGDKVRVENTAEIIPLV